MKWIFLFINLLKKVLLNQDLELKKVAIFPQRKLSKGIFWLKEIIVKPIIIDINTTTVSSNRICLKFKTKNKIIKIKKILYKLLRNGKFKNRYINQLAPINDARPLIPSVKLYAFIKTIKQNTGNKYLAILIFKNNRNQTFQNLNCL